MKRWGIIDILKEILRACGNLIDVEMVWLRGIPENAGIDNGKYEIVIRAKFDNRALACVTPVNERFRLKMRQEDDLWIFSRESGFERVVPSPRSV